MNLQQRCRNLTGQRLCLLVEALFHLAAARLALGMLPYRRYERLLGPAPCPAQDFPVVAAQAVGSAVRRAAALVPWRSDCLLQATAALWMLRRRKAAARLHIGVAAGGNPLIAHAWLTYESAVLTGRRGHRRFHTIRTY
jgi:hypothetical protein